MKSFITGLIVLFTTFNLLGQSPKYKISESTKGGRFSSLRQATMTQDGKNIIALKYTPKNFQLPKQELSLIDLETMKIKEVETIEDEYIFKILPLKTDTYLLVFNKKELLLKAQKIDKTSLKRIGEPMTILPIKKERRGSALSLSRKGYHFPLIGISRDSTKVGFYISTGEKSKDLSYAAAVYDQDFKKIWSKTQKKSTKTKYNYITPKLIVKNNGTLYTYIADFYKSKKFTAIQIKKDSEKEYTSSLERKKLKVMHVEITDREEGISGVNLLSFFNNNVGTGHLSKINITTLDSDLDVISNEDSRFLNKDFVDIAETLTERKKEKTPRINYLRIRNIHVSSSGEKLVFANQYAMIHSTTTRTAGSPTPRAAGSPTPGNSTNHTISISSSSIHGGGLIAIKFDRNNQLVWAKSIPMKQMSHSYTPIMGYIISEEVNGKLFIIFNDNIKNLNSNKASAKSFGGKDSILKAVQLDLKTGKTNDKLIFSRKKEKDLWPLLSSSFNIGNGNTIILGHSKKQEKSIIKLMFK